MFLREERRRHEDGAARIDTRIPDPLSPTRGRTLAPRMLLRRAGDGYYPYCRRVSPSSRCTRRRCGRNTERRRAATATPAREGVPSELTGLPPAPPERPGLRVTVPASASPRRHPASRPRVPFPRRRPFDPRGSSAGRGRSKPLEMPEHGHPFGLGRDASRRRQRRARDRGRPRRRCRRRSSACSRGQPAARGRPGVGKTMLAARWRERGRHLQPAVQATPDLLPSDLTGSPSTTSKQGVPVRSGPCSPTWSSWTRSTGRRAPLQSALLEAEMEERQVTVEGVTHRLPRP